jgi:hypothetical protein
MFHRIEMNVFHVAAKIMFIAYLMFPESPLPDGRFPSAYPRSMKPVVTLKKIFHLPRKGRFNDTPAGREIPISLGQRPYAM